MVIVAPPEIAHEAANAAFAGLNSEQPGRPGLPNVIQFDDRGMDPGFRTAFFDDMRSHGWTYEPRGREAQVP